MKTLKAECIYKKDALLAECPVWSEKKRALYWVDILKGSIHCFDPQSGNHETFDLKQLVSSLGLLKDGRLILTLLDEIALFDPKTTKLEVIASFDNPSKANRFNDGKCDRLGRYWCTTLNMKDLSKDTAALYRLDHTHTLHLMEERVVTGNGMDWSPDNSLFYFTQTLRHSIFVYDFAIARGLISNRHCFIEIDPRDGLPDGITVDEEGCIWVALYGKGEVVRFDPKGRPNQMISLPVPHVTSCTFGGDHLETLYITTAQENMTAEQIKTYPLSGSLFAVEPGVRGLPETFCTVY